MTTTPPVEGSLLRVEGLTVDVIVDGQPVRILDGVDLEVARGETLGIIGESGSGKSVAAQAIMRLLGPAAVLGGKLLWNGQDVLRISERQMRRLRGKSIAMIFQDPLASLNPTQRVWRQIAENLRGGQTELRESAVDLLRVVGIPDAAERADSYPHQLSGGQRQRVMIAMALAGSPELLIADEATTALDVTVQARILDLLATIRRERGLSLLMISHDLRVVAHTADRVLVLYAGRVCESGPTLSVIRRPAHPYTRALRDNVPSVRASRREGVPLPGAPVGPTTRPTGCALRTRCPLAVELCAQQVPALRRIEDRMVACHRAEEVLEGSRT